MQRIISSAAMAALLGGLPAGGWSATDLFFSEYIEGSGNNKALEIANTTGQPVDLSDYQVQMYFNGNTSPGLTLTLEGNLAPGEVYVLAHSSAVPEVLAVADQTGGGGWFNGDDAVVLTVGGLVVDAIGQIGVDPGSFWGNGDNTTQNHTLRRLPSVDGGDSNAFDAFDPAAEWEALAQDTFDNLGAFDGGAGEPPPTTGQCGDEATRIHAIQGEGDVSPLTGTTQTIEGIVVGDFQGGDALRGFFVQEEAADEDANPATSEGVFVFDGSGAVAVNTGDIVRVTGSVTEYFNLTQLNNVSAVTVCGSGASVAPAVVQLPLTEAGELERFEGMAVSFPQTLTVTENYNLGRYGELLLSANGRLFTPTQVAAPGADALAVQAANALNRILLDDGSSAQNPESIIFPAPELSAFNTVRSGDEVAGLQGVLTFGFGQYRVQPTAAPVFIQANARTAEPELPGTGGLKIASFNVLNYFNGDGVGDGFPTERGANTTAEFERQRDKILNALLAMDADIVGLVEIENDGYGPGSAIQDLVAGLNSAGAGYAFIDPGVSAIGSDAISVGLIYKTDRVEPLHAAAILDATVDSRFNDSKNRPALAQSFRELATRGVLTVAVNHLKSKGSDCDDLGDPDTGDGQGNCNLTRTAAAEALVDWLVTDPTGSGDSDFLILGDLNAYAKEDPIRVFENGGYVNLAAQFSGGEGYSYVFDGQVGNLDHALASGSLQAQVTGLSEWHINADEPRVLDYNEEFKTPEQVVNLYNAEPYRSSDHDPLVVELALTGHLAGDCNLDGRLDLKDLKVLVHRLRQEAEANDPCDLNGDWVIDRWDLRLWLRLFIESRTGN